MGAKPKYLTCSFIIEEGFAVSDIRKIAESMAKTASEAGVSIVAGDTKVAPRGECGGVFITTTGLGEVLTDGIGCANVCDGDVVIVTGDIGRHGCAVLLARGDFGIDADIESDCAPLWGMVSDMMAVSKIHAMRDATRGGVGTVLNEIAVESVVNINIDETALPVNDAVRGVCGLLGLDPLYMACEGRMVVFVSKIDSSIVLDALKKHKYGKNAAIIGSVTKTDRPNVTVNTTAGGQRLLPPPGGELLPRIC
jgi:hydrogenase expression/formation protein HypE